MGRQPGAMDDGSLVDAEASGGWLQDVERRAASGSNLVWDFGKGSALHLGELTARARTAHNIQILQIDEQGNRAEERPADLGLREHVCGLTMMTALWGFLGFLFMCYSKVELIAVYNCIGAMCLPI